VDRKQILINFSNSLADLISSGLSNLPQEVSDYVLSSTEAGEGDISVYLLLNPLRIEVGYRRRHGGEYTYLFRVEDERLMTRH